MRNQGNRPETGNVGMHVIVHKLFHKNRYSKFFVIPQHFLLLLKNWENFLLQEIKIKCSARGENLKFKNQLVYLS